MVRIREASFDDIQAVKSLEEQYGLDSKYYNTWQHLWKDNPAAYYITGPWPLGWVLIDDKDKVRGYLGNIPVEYTFKGRRLIAAVTNAFVVNKDFRNYSILLAKSFFSQKNADLLLVTSANYESGRVFSAFNAQKAPASFYDIILFWIINYQGLISSVFIKENLPFRGVLKYPLSLALWTSDSFLKRNQLPAGLNSKIQETEVFDSRFDIFWDRLKERYPNRLLRVRNRKYLNWHFKDAIAQKRLWVLTVEKESMITAYAIFLRWDNARIGLKRIRLIDIQSIDDSPAALEELLLFGMSRCKQEKVDIFEIIGFNTDKRSIIKKYRPHERKMPGWPSFYKSNDTHLQEGLALAEAWDPSLLDGDSSLYIHNK